MLKIALTIAMMTTYAERFIRTYEMRAVYPFDKTQVSPARAGEPRLREVALFTPDGETLVLWVAAPTPGVATVFYLPGNAGNLASRTRRFTYFLDQGYGVVALGYRGSSGSTGSPDETSLTRDAFQVFDALADLIALQGGPVVIYGESLGTAMAVKIAAARNADGVVLEAPFTSFVDLSKSHYPMLDLSSILTQFWDTQAIVGALDEPLLVLHGTDDQVVPLAQGQTVFRLAGSSNKQMVELAGIGHSGVWTAQGLDAILGFVDRIGALP